jgi:hypothetical protein
LRNIAEAMPSAVDPMQRFAEALGADEPRDAMREACAALRLKGGQVEPPIGLKAIRLHLRAIERLEPMRARGLMTTTSTGFEIRVSDVSGWRRARFTVAHEIAHIVMLQALADDPAAFNALFDDEYLPSIEWLCNWGAQELLIPSEDLLARLLEHGFTPDGLRALYLRYQVSWDMLLIAIAETLGASVTVWSYGVRPDDGDMARVVQTYGDWGRSIWLPRGLSTGSLSSDIVGRALRSGGAGAEAMLRARPRGREIWGRALASEIRGIDLDPPRLPLRILRAGDEAAPGKAALLLLDPGDQVVWPALRGSSQLRFPVAVAA